MTITRTMTCDGCKQPVNSSEERTLITMKEPDLWSGSRELIPAKHFHSLHCLQKYITKKLEKRAAGEAKRAAFNRVPGKTGD